MRDTDFYCENDGCTTGALPVEDSLVLQYIHVQIVFFQALCTILHIPYYRHPSTEPLLLMK